MHEERYESGHGRSPAVWLPAGRLRAGPEPSARPPQLQFGELASPRPGFGTLRQEWSTVLLEARDGKLGDRPGGSRPVDILDACALVTAQEREHGILGNRQNQLPTRGGCSGEARNSAR